MSALQALEFETESIIAQGVPIGPLVKLMMEGAESLAMPALVVGLLTRHLEAADGALDPFLVEPLIWRLEFQRSSRERSSGMAALVPNIVFPERREWSLREVSMALALSADDERRKVLRGMGDRLVENARAGLEDPDADRWREGLATVRGWADALDGDQYRFTRQNGQLYVEQASNPDVEAVLSAANADLRRTHEAIGLEVRHTHGRDTGGRAPNMSPEEIASDVAVARDLLENPPDGLDVALAGPTGATASALELHFGRGVSVGTEDLVWCAAHVLAVGEGLGRQPVDAFDESLFAMGPVAQAARGAPYLLLPEARGIREALAFAGADRFGVFSDVQRHLSWRAPNEARLMYARHLDAVWNAPCANELGGRCHHRVALDLVYETFRDCVIGPWDIEHQQRGVVELEPPVVASLEKVLGKDIVGQRLCAGLRAIGAAASTRSCVQVEAQASLSVVVAAHQRRRTAERHAPLHSHSDSLLAARAVLDQAADGRPNVVLDYVAGYLVKPEALGEGLLALGAAAEERATRAAAAADIWPRLMDLVMDDVVLHPSRYSEERSGPDALSELVPRAAYTFGYLTLEFDDEPITWRRLVEWAPQIERWLPLVAGSRQCIDALVMAVSELDKLTQIAIGLPWIDRAVQPGGQGCANTTALPTWLRDRRPDITAPEDHTRWQRIVDVLVTSGDIRVADLAD